MKSAIVRLAVSALVAAGCLSGLGGPSYAQFVLYDDFSSGNIDTEKWTGVSEEGTFDAPTTEAVRGIKNGSLRIGLVSWGGNASDSGSVRSRDGLNMRQLGTLGGSGFITALSAKVTVHIAEAQDCPTNPETDVPSRSRAQLIGAFFNDGTSAAAGDRTGDIVAHIQVQKERNGANRIVASVNRCPNAACTPSSVPLPLANNPAVFAATWSLDTPLILKLVWDDVNGKFKFTVTDPLTVATEPKSIDYSGTVT